MWFGQLGISSALWTEQIARNWLTYQLTGSALQLGLVNLMRALPVMALGLWGGVLTDRLDRRMLFLIIQGWSFLVYVLMGWVVLSGSLALWHLYASSFALSLGMAMDGPLRTSTIPSTVPPERLINALSLNGLAINGTRLFLPAGVGVMLGVANPGWAYLGLAGVYLLIQVFTLQLHLPDTRSPERSSSMLGDMREGFAFVRKDRTIRALLMAAVGVQGIGFSHRVLVPVFVGATLGMGSGAYGLLLSADGLGAVLFGLGMASFGIPRRRGLYMIAVSTANAVAILLLGFADWLPLAMLVVMVSGGSSTAFRSSNNTLLLGETPVELRGRVMSFNGLNQGIAPMLMVVWGFLADLTNVTVALVALGSLALVVQVTVHVFEPRIRRL
jgi:MFS family permease